MSEPKTPDRKRVIAIDQSDHRHACPVCHTHTITTRTDGEQLIHEGQKVYCLNCGLDGLIGLDAESDPILIWQVKVSLAHTLSATPSKAGAH